MRTAPLVHLPALLALALAAPAAAESNFAPLLDDPAFAQRFTGTIRVTRGDQVLLELSRGTDRAGRAATQETVYWIGSISKHFAAATLLSVLEEMAIPLDRPVASLLPGWPPDALSRDGVACTPELLLSHQCGIPRGLARPSADLHRDPQAEAAFLERLKGTTLEFAPGTAYAYSNPGFDLVGVLASRLGGAPYHALLQRRLLAPRGLAVTGAKPDGGDLDQRAAPGHFPVLLGSLSSETWLGIPWDAPSRVGASGDLLSTAPELERWFRALLGGGVLGESTLAAMLEPRREDYGFGLVIEKRPEGPLVWHNGALSPHGHNAFVGHQRATDTTVVVLSNQGRSYVSATRIGLGLMELAHGRKPDPMFEHAASKQLAGGMPGLVHLGLPLFGLLWCAMLVRRCAREGRVAWALQLQTALFLVVVTEMILGAFRPPRPLVLPLVLAAQIALLSFGGRRFRAQPLIAEGRLFSVALQAVVIVGVQALLSIGLGVWPPVLALSAVSAAALLAMKRFGAPDGAAPRESKAA